MTLIDQIQSIREERDALRIELAARDAAIDADRAEHGLHFDRVKRERDEALAKLSIAYHTAEVRYGERVAADAALASLRARVTEYLDAIDTTDRERASRAVDLTEAALRAEVQK